MENQKKKFLDELPFLLFTGMLGLSFLGVILYFIWALVLG